MAWRVRIQEPDLAAREEDLAPDGPTVVGRAPDPSERGLPVRDLYASKRHAVLRPHDDLVDVSDLGSSNGVHLNGFRIGTNVAARPGDVVRVGRTTLCLTWLPPAAPEAASGLSLPAGLASRFVPLARLTQHATGTVLKAQRADGSACVALKLVRAEGSSAGQHLARELRILRRLDHPNVVRLLEGGETDGHAWLATEWIEGRTLTEHVRQVGPMAEGEVVTLGGQLSGALGAAHRLGVIHRDVKPDNVMLDGRKPWPCAVLVDFGLAAPLSASTASRLTTTGAVKGTPLYMAPEQLRDSKHAGPAADQFGLAATLYFALTRAWHVKETGRGVWMDLLESVPVPLADRRRDLSPALVRALDRALLAQPERRHPSVEALQRALTG